MTTKVDENVLKILSFISSKTGLLQPASQRIPYYHMGATITDAVLQAGMNYKNVVYPRIIDILTKYPDYTTTCDFIILFQTIPIEDIVKWKNPKKLNLICDLTWLFYNNEINTEIQLSNWLCSEKNVEELIKIKGIGLKTLDYLKLLSGLQSIPVDRHMFQFLSMAGVYVKTYEEASELLKKVAQRLKVGESILDTQIWTYMAGR